jgi:maleylpyruvate isomerase
MAAADPSARAPDRISAIQAVEDATAHLLRTIDGLTDEQARGDSLLRGWTRGHVLTHIARNADALINLTVWARTGIRTPMYPSREVRAETIQAQSGRPAAELAVDIVESHERLMIAVNDMTDDDWAKTYGDPDRVRPATYILTMRRTEVEVHHVDLGLDYTLAHWPEDFVEDLLEETVEDMTSRGTAPGFTMVGNDDEGRWTVGSGGQTITGPPPALLGWLIGRTDGIGVHSDEPLPTLEPWR